MVLFSTNIALLFGLLEAGLLEAGLKSRECWPRNNSQTIDNIGQMIPLMEPFQKRAAYHETCMDKLRFFCLSLLFSEPRFPRTPNWLRIGVFEGNDVGSLVEPWKIHFNEKLFCNRINSYLIWSLLLDNLVVLLTVNYFKVIFNFNFANIRTV